MKVLIITAEPPCPPTHGGARLTLYHFMKHASTRHELTLLTLLEHPAERESLSMINPYCVKLQAVERQPAGTRPSLRQRWQAPFYRMVFSQPMAAAIQEELATTAYDLIHVHTAHAAVYTPLLRGRRKLLSAVDSQTLAYTSRLQLAHGWRQKLRAHYLLHHVRNFERDQYRHYDCCVVVADEDRQVIQGLCPQLPVVAIPLGVDLEHLRPTDPALEIEGQLVFSGTMDYAPNADAARWFAEDILPTIQRARPGVTLQIVGRAPTPAVLALAQRPAISVTGFVPDLRPLVATAAVYVCPLRCGSGMKCKILEAMAMGKAIVTTSEGVSGIAGRDGEHYLVADRPEPFTTATLELLNNPARRRQLGHAARQFVEANYSWERTAASYDRQYQQITASR